MSTAPRNRWLEAIDDLDLLNTLLDADPALRQNMLEMGFIKSVPFQLDHNNATVAKYQLTAYGVEEVQQRYVQSLQHQRKLLS